MDVPKLPHHDQKSLCKTRAPYRQGRKLTAVKVYTISDESVYLLITKVPDIKLESEVTSLCHKFGVVKKIENLPNYPHDKFETTYLVEYSSVRFARKAKRALDGRNFFGGVLHVCYSPELETVEETASKLRERKSAYLSFQSKCLQKEKNSECKKLFEDSKRVSVNQSDGVFNNSSHLNNSFASTHLKRPINISFEGSQNKSENYTVDSDFDSNVAVPLSSKNRNSELPYKKRLVSSNIKELPYKKRLVSSNIKSFRRSRNFVSKVSQPPMNNLRKPIQAKNVKIK